MILILCDGENYETLGDLHDKYGYQQFITAFDSSMKDAIKTELQVIVMLLNPPDKRANWSFRVCTDRGYSVCRSTADMVRAHPLFNSVRSRANHLAA